MDETGEGSRQQREWNERLSSRGIDLVEGVADAWTLRCRICQRTWRVRPRKSVGRPKRSYGMCPGGCKSVPPVEYTTVTVSKGTAEAIERLAGMLTERDKRFVSKHDALSKAVSEMIWKMGAKPAPPKPRAAAKHVPTSPYAPRPLTGPRR